MGFWWFALIFSVFMPVLMLICAVPMQKTHKGYHSRRSLKNEETNAFANEYCGKLWKKLGLAMLIPSVIPVLLCLKAGTRPDPEAWEGTIGITMTVVVVVQSVIMIATIFMVERALKETFGERGY